MEKKRMTNREKEERAKMKKKLQEKGLVPPDKPRLNRKNYVEECIEMWNRRDKDYYLWHVMLQRAISIMCGHVDRNLRVSQEAIGAAKCLKLAIRLKEFSDKLKAEGRTEYKVSEQVEYIKDILLE